MSVARKVTVGVFAETAEAQRKLDAIAAEAEALGKLNPEIRPQIDRRAASQSLAVLTAEMKAAGKEAEGLGTSAEGASGGIGSMVTPMTALVVPAAALAPVITTLGVGTAGFGIAAAGAVAPVFKAAQATGGLRANMAKLDPEQRKVAHGLLGLGQQYRAFEKALQPQVLTAFSGGLRIAGHLLHDLEPVSKATGIAIGGLLNAVDQEFQSGTWQDFFGFMARTAGPDVKLLTSNLVDLMQALPPLLEGLQPVATGVLTLTDDILKAAAAGARWLDVIEKLPPANTRSADSLSSWAESVTNRWIPGARSVNHWLRSIQGDLGGTAAATGKSAGAFRDAGPPARELGTHIQSAAIAVKGLMTAEQNALNTQTTYAGDLVTTANDVHDLRQKLKASHDMIGLHTQAQRDSFASANQYITYLGNTASAAVKSGHGVDGAIRAIRDGLPILDSAKSKNKAYWQEVRTLKGWLDKLRTEKNIRELVIVTGQGRWTMHNPKGQSLPGGFPGGVGAAAGWRVPGFGGGDRWPALLEGGEAVVPKHLTPALAPFLKANRVPGFEAGGIAGHFTGSVPGLGRWAAADNRAAVRDLETGLASIMITAIRQAQKAQLATGGGGPHGPIPSGSVGQWIARALGIDRTSLSWLPGMGTLVGAESGGNPRAYNPVGDASGHAEGIAQMKPGTFAAYALPGYGNIWNPIDNLVSSIRYIHANYGTVYGIPGLGTPSYRGYDSGTRYLPRGLSLAYNGTSRAERVGGEDLAPLLRETNSLLRQVIQATANVPAATSHGIGEVLSGAARRSAHNAMYSAL